jgi:subtilisin family serine protease
MELWTNSDSLGANPSFVPGLAAASPYGLAATGLVADDYAASSRTSAVVPVGGVANGVLEQVGDHDWFAADLVAGRRYTIRQTGISLREPMLRLRNAGGRVVASKDDSDAGNDALIRFRPQGSGRYFLDAGAVRDRLTGTYQVSLSDTTEAPRAAQQLDDFAANTTSQGLVSPGGSSSSGRLETAGDHDWFQVSVQAGRSYEFRLTGVSLTDPVLRLRDGTGAEIAVDNNSGGGTHSLIRHTAVSSGNLWLDAGAFGDRLTGSYSVAATDVTPAQGFSSLDGYGSVNVARALELLTGQPLARQPALAGVLWGLDQVGAPTAWAAGITGAGITVAVVDTGVDYLHPELDQSIWSNAGEIAANGIDDDANGFIDDVRGWDFTDADNDPMDLHGHGTHVAGLIAAENNAIGQTGVAYGARILPVRVLDATGFGSFSTVALGVRYAIAAGARVINLSITGAFGTPDLAAAIFEAQALGVVVVMAAGNTGAPSPADPAAFASLAGLAVGALDNTGTLAGFSNRAGSAPINYVTAPGVGLLSTMPGNGSGIMSGTSMAAPHVAGVAALLLSVRPDLSAETVVMLITASASRGDGVLTVATSQSVATNQTVAANPVTGAASAAGMTTVSRGLGVEEPWWLKASAVSAT